MAENTNKEILDAIQGLKDTIQGLASHMDERLSRPKSMNQELAMLRSKHDRLAERMVVLENKFAIA